MGNDNIKKFNQFINENIDLSSEYGMINLFSKYIKMFEPETKVSINGLRESVELIGDGEITKKYDDDGYLLYKEMLKNDKFILVIHAQLSYCYYTNLKGYTYSVGVYRNKPTLNQYGGGYGASGLLVKEHPTILYHGDVNKILNRNVISKVCADVKKYVLDKYN